MDLDSLQPTQDSLWNAATRAMSSSTPEALRRTWNDAFTRASPSHRLTLLYFANEICQRSRRTHPEFLSERCFGAILPDAFATVTQEKPEYEEKLNRILQVWQERGVFQSDDLDRIRSAMKSNGKGNKRLRPSSSPPSASPDHTGLPQASPASDNAENLLSMDPVMASMARANSAVSLISNDIDEVPGEGTLAGESFVMEVVRIAKTLDVPEEYDSLFRRIAQGESDNVKYELDQENLDRLALKVYKIAKTRVLAGGMEELEHELEAIAEFQFAKTLDQEEARVKEDMTVNKDIFDAVETTEHVVVDVKQALQSIQSRQTELNQQLDRDQQILVELSELLDTKFPLGQPDPALALGITNEEKEEELSQLTDYINKFEQLIGGLTEKIERQQAQETERLALQQQFQQQLLQQQQQFQQLQQQQQQQYQPPQQQQSTRPRRQRWGAPTTEVPVSAWGPPVNAGTTAPETQAWVPPPSAAWPQGTQATTEAGYQYPPPPMDYYPQWYPPPPTNQDQQHHQPTHGQYQHQQGPRYS